MSHKLSNTLILIKNLEQSMHCDILFNDATRIMTEMCKGCLESRENSCENCKSLHCKLDVLENEMQPGLYDQNFKFNRSTDERPSVFSVTTKASPP